MKNLFPLIFVLVLFSCKKNDVNPAPKIVISKPVTDYPNRYWDTKVPIDVYVYDKDGLNDVTIVVSSAQGVVYTSSSGAINQTEYKLAVNFVPTSMYGQDPLNCVITVEATDARGAKGKQNVPFKIYDL